MKIKRFKLKDNVTKEDLIALHFKSGGSWIMKDAELSLTKYFVYKGLNNSELEYSIGVAFGSNINDWNDFDNVLVLDDDFGQPYTPFYGDNYGEDITDFPALENVILKYNEFMSSLGIFEEINERDKIIEEDNCQLEIIIKELQDELKYTKKERDAAIADITEFAKFYRRRTICDFCKHDSEEECCSHCKNYFINDCFEWRGYKS